MSYGRSGAIVLVIGLMASVGAGGDRQSPFKLSPDEQKLLELTNAERAKHDLPPLKVHPALLAAARDHARNMAKQQRLSHDLDGKSPIGRLSDVKYDYQRAGENIAVKSGPTDPAEIVRLWMESPGHRANILNEGYREIGVGIARCADGNLYYAQVFGTRAE
ncbi:MAG: CAP domain-containing protein [Gemmataceae bacterium]|nr:CAP domain-containing protein [Gemmataceae bacterium]